MLEGRFTAKDIAEAATALACGPPSLMRPERLLAGEYQGWMWTEQFHPGLVGSALDLMSTTDTHIVQPIEPAVMISVMLRGTGGTFGPVDGDLAENPVGRARIVGIGETARYERRWSAGNRTVRVGVVVDRTFIDEYADTLAPPELGPIASLMDSGYRDLTVPECPVMTHLSHSLIEAPYTGSLGRLFRESTTTQIMFQAVRLLRAGGDHKKQIGRRRHDAVLHAQAILDRSLLAPPGTIALARLVGVNRNDLQAGFKAVFGKTIFAYVRTQRLNVARVLIEDHGSSAAEAGYKVGFSSPSAFSAAFRRMFGRSPKAGKPG